MPADYESDKLNRMIKEALQGSSLNISEDITDFLTAKSKKLRPLLVFLFSKALGLDVTDKIYSLACAVELAHNAALIHDDIIDCAEIRRGKVSLNSKLGSTLSVLSGDILLSIALKQLVKTGNIEVSKIFADCLFNMCTGEINQKSDAFKVPSMSDYIKKSEYKTAELFKAALDSLCIIENISEKEKIIEFAKLFGTAFQIKDDLFNITGKSGGKPSFSDIHNGIYTAPVIYLNQDMNIENMTETEIINAVRDRKYINKTVDLIEEYALKALQNIEFLPDSRYKQEITSMTENLYKAV